jgi:hypothetical protein
MEDQRPRYGIRVFELSIAVAAPSAGRYLAFQGADVIKAESRAFPDVARLFGSAWARTPDRDRGAAVVEATAEGEETWLAQMRAVARDRRDFQDTCTPGYYNNEGQIGRGRGFTDNLFGGTSAQFYGLLRDWRDAGDLAGLTQR